MPQTPVGHGLLLFLSPGLVGLPQHAEYASQHWMLKLVWVPGCPGWLLVETTKSTKKDNKDKNKDVKYRQPFFVIFTCKAKAFGQMNSSHIELIAP